MKLKKLLTFLLSVMLILSVVPMGLFSITASAATSVTTDDCIWKLDGTVLTISGNGKMKDYTPAEYLPGGRYRKNITEVIIKNGVTNIGNYAFYDCTALTNITISDSVTTVGNYAFYGCAGLTSIAIPNSVTSIGGSAFWNCAELTSIAIPNSVTHIGSLAFWNCTGLTSIAIPNSVTQIDDFAFLGCKNLTNVTISNNLKIIANGVFSGCTKLTDISIPNSVTSIGNNAFDECLGLKSVTIPDSVTSIGFNAFLGCKNLTNVKIPNNVINICNGAFSACDNIMDITVSQNSIGNLKDVFANYQKIKKVTLDEKTYYISELAFSGFQELENIRLPETITGIGNYSFYGCKSLKNITIPKSVTSIGNEVFSECNKGLTILTYKSSVADLFAEKNGIHVKYIEDSDNATLYDEKKQNLNNPKDDNNVSKNSSANDITGTLLKINEGIFPAGTELTVEEIKTDNPIFDSANNILKDICNEFKLYNIKALLNGAEVTPNGEIAATFNIPDGYGRDIALYLIKSDGTSEKLDFEISEDGHTLSAKLNELGNYAICKLGDGESTSKTEDDITLEKPEKNNTAVYIIIAVCAVTLIGGIVSFVVIKKKRK